MAEPFLSEIRIMSFGFAPKGWALCNGQLLPINQNQALFSLLGTTYGGDGRVNFGLPNLQARVPIHEGAGYTLGQLAGENTHTLNTSEMAQHNHIVNAIAAAAGSGAGGHIPANTKLLGQAAADVSGNETTVNLYGSGNPSRRSRRSRSRRPAAIRRTRTGSLTSCSTSASRCRASSRRKRER